MKAIQPKPNKIQNVIISKNIKGHNMKFLTLSILTATTLMAVLDVVGRTNLLSYIGTMHPTGQRVLPLLSMTLMHRQVRGCGIG